MLYTVHTFEDEALRFSSELGLLLAELLQLEDGVAGVNLDLKLLAIALPDRQLDLARFVINHFCAQIFILTRPSIPLP